MKASALALLFVCGLVLLVSTTQAHSTLSASSLLQHASLRVAAATCQSKLHHEAQARFRLAEAAAKLSRRRTANSILSAASKVETSSCTADSEVTEGPYYIRNEFQRSDIRDGEPGVPLILDFTLIDVSNCSYVPYSAIELWHCNATGTYAGFTGIDPDTGSMKSTATCVSSTPSSSTPVSPPSGGPGGPGGGGGSSSTTCMTDYMTFLRGYQVTNELGNVQMTTIYPGFYTGRTPHVHVMIRTSDTTVRHIGQLFFDDDMTSTVFTYGDYAAHITKVGDTWIRTANDGIYQGSGAGTLNLVQLDDTDISQGVIGAVNIYIDSTATRSVSSTNYLAPSVTQPPSAPYTTTPVPPVTASTPTSTPTSTPSSTPTASTPTSSSSPSDSTTNPSSSASRVLISSIVVIGLVALTSALFLEWKERETDNQERRRNFASADNVQLETMDKQIQLESQ